MRIGLIIFLLLFNCATYAQLNISNPFYVAGTLKPAASGAGNGLLNNLYSVWEMEQADNTDVVDATGQSHTATHWGTTQRTTTGHIEGSFANDSAQNAGWTNFSSSAYNTNGDFSGSAWLINSQDADVVLGYNQGGTKTNSFTVFFDAAGLFGTANHWVLLVRKADNSGNFKANSLVAANTGTNLVVWAWNNTTKVGYLSVNGEAMVNTGTTDGLNSNTDEGAYFGNVGGQIDETCWWVNRVLTDTEVTALKGSYNFSTGAGTPLLYSGGGWTN